MLMYSGEALYVCYMGNSVKLNMFGILMRAVRGITYCQHPPPAHGGPRFGGKCSNLHRKKMREQSLQMFFVTKPEKRWTVTTVKRLLEISLTYKNAEKQISVKAKMARNVSPFSYFPIFFFF